MTKQTKVKLDLTNKEQGTNKYPYAIGLISALLDMRNDYTPTDLLNAIAVIVANTQPETTQNDTKKNDKKEGEKYV